MNNYHATLEEKKAGDNTLESVGVHHHKTVKQVTTKILFLKQISTSFYTRCRG